MYAGSPSTCSCCCGRHLSVRDRRRGTAPWSASSTGGRALVADAGALDSLDRLCRRGAAGDGRRARIGRRRPAGAARVARSRERYAIDRRMIGLMVVHGAAAGNFSPLNVLGAIVHAGGDVARARDVGRDALPGQPRLQRGAGRCHHRWCSGAHGARQRRATSRRSHEPARRAG